jgi:hypothetical protein
MGEKTPDDPEPKVIPDSEESEKGDSFFLEKLAHECMRLSPVPGGLAKAVPRHRTSVGTGNRLERKRNSP